MVVSGCRSSADYAFRAMLSMQSNGFINFHHRLAAVCQPSLSLSLLFFGRTHLDFLCRAVHFNLRENLPYLSSMRPRCWTRALFFFGLSLFLPLCYQSKYLNFPVSIFVDFICSPALRYITLQLLSSLSTCFAQFWAPYSAYFSLFYYLAIDMLKQRTNIFTPFYL